MTHVKRRWTDPIWSPVSKGDRSDLRVLADDYGSHGVTGEALLYFARRSSIAFSTLVRKRWYDFDTLVELREIFDQNHFATYWLWVPDPDVRLSVYGRCRPGVATVAWNFALKHQRGEYSSMACLAAAVLEIVPPGSSADRLDAALQLVDELPSGWCGYPCHPLSGEWARWVESWRAVVDLTAGDA